MTEMREVDINELPDELKRRPEPGMFYWWGPPDLDHWRLYFACPNRRWCNVPVFPARTHPTPGKPEGSSWQHDGNFRKPTLTPSINCKDCWHGHITAGVIK